uniref:AIG1-type G domain-containing protein n=1 Tax=Cyprinus carpio TaxID=7962 RepID=A0A8C1LRA1_CYPCA
MNIHVYSAQRHQIFQNTCQCRSFKTRLKFGGNRHLFCTMASTSVTKVEKGRRGSFGLNPPSYSQIRLVLVGMTGAGKSSSGNTILGRRAFTAARRFSSVTKECGKVSENVAGREITLVDTPGMFDTDMLEEELLKEEISKCINMTAPGPHAILLVIQFGSFTKEEKLSVEKVRAIFGEESDKHTIILFTHGDELDCSIEEHISEANEDLKEILRRCGKRYQVFNNKDMEDRNQVVELLEKVDAMVAANGGEYYTSDTYHDVERMLKTKEDELRREYENKLQEKERELKATFAEEKQKLEERLNEYKRYYETQLREFRLKEEQTNTNENKLIKILTKLKILTV